MDATSKKIFDDFADKVSVAAEEARRAMLAALAPPPEVARTRGEVVAAESVNDIGGSILRIGNEVHCGVAFRIAPKVSDILPTLREVVAALIDAERADAAKGERERIVYALNLEQAAHNGLFGKRSSGLDTAIEVAKGEVAL